MKATPILTLLSAYGAMLAAWPAAGQSRFETLYDFTTNPVGVTAIRGKLFAAAWYVTTTQWTCGTISELQPTPSGGPWVETTLYAFSETGGDGCEPDAAPIPGPGGGLYGTTLYGGAYNDGELYELQPPSAPGGAWTESVLYSFDLPNRGTGYPGPPIPGPNGSFYCGAGGGLYGFGALVQLGPPSMPGGPWSQTVLYNFATVGPNVLIPGPEGSLYGAGLDGQIVQFDPPVAPGGAWTETVLYNVPSSDGLGPNSLTLASDGTLYGTAFGSSYDQGIGKATVFQLTPPASGGGAWSFTLLQNFGENVNLNSPLILRNGNLYGTADSFTGGQVFELQPPATPGGAWTRVPLHQFSGNQLPGGTLVMDQRGGLFGVTAAPYLQPPNGTVYWLATK
jgi:uncharacterized repeat protein (TIGR03803 family)